VARGELILCQLLIVAFASLLLVNVVRRYGFDAPFYFAEELAVYILIWMAFLAIAATIARREMIALTFVVEALPEGVRRVVAIVVDVLMLAMMVAILWAAIGWWRSPAVAFELALTLGTSKQPFYLIVPLFAGLAAFHLLANLLADLSGASENAR
jgi:TRAP-type C4-dicarboxylate transport system permease small subunit